MPIYDLLDKSKYVPGSVKAFRLEKCNQCEHLGALRRCKLCSCFVKQKTKLKTGAARWITKMENGSLAATSISSF